ncbi:Uncharacterised protein [Mycobacteroides abscessus]|nr:Uncharacterised protein [Mycobacteroides abscessus]
MSESGELLDAQRSYLRYRDDMGLFTDEGVEVVGASLPG